MPPDSSVRVPEDLLSRAMSLNPDNRSEVVRAALELGLGTLEDRKLLEEGGDIVAIARRVFQEAVLSDPALAHRIAELVSTFSPRKEPLPFAVLPFLHDFKDAKGNDKSGDDAPFPVLKFESYDNPQSIGIPACPWMIYEPVNIRIHAENPNARVEVAKLCSDEGAGRNLLLHGWHGPEAFAGRGTALAKHEIIISPNSLIMNVRADRPTRAVVSLIVKVKRDDAWFGGVIGTPRGGVGAFKPPKPEPPKLPPTRGRLIRVPFLPSPHGSREALKTRSMNWGVLRIDSLVFSEHPERFNTMAKNFKIGGSPNLFFQEDWISAVDLAEAHRNALRAWPIIISPNIAHLDVRNVYPEKTDLTAPAFLIAEVVRDDAFSG